MKSNLKRILYQKRSGFTSLAEIIAALLIASLLAVATIRIYTRANSTAGSLRRFLEKDDDAKMVLQRISEDIDKIAKPGTDASLTVENKFAEGYNICRLTIESKIYDVEGKPLTFEKIVWQSIYDPVVDGLTIYRAHSGMAVEDKVLARYETMVNAWEGRELFVPVVTGVSYFKIDIPQLADIEDMSGGFYEAGVAAEPQTMFGPAEIEAEDSWNSEELPKAVRMSISFEPVIELATGGYDVYEEEKIYRTVAIDRMKKMEYKLNLAVIPDINDFKDVNDFDDVNDFNDFNDMDDVDFEQEPNDMFLPEELRNR